AYLGIPSNVPSCRLLLRMAYQRVTLINYFHSSMIRYDPSLYLIGGREATFNSARLSSLPTVNEEEAS
ncbi:hypothetical protein S245_040292, partial [Arachis hypogaea]